MRGRAFLLLVGALSGCGLVSGLDGLEVEDASVNDATTATDASDASETVDSSDAAVEADAGNTDVAAGGTGSVRCGQAFCDGGIHCCVSGNGPYTYTCLVDCGGNAVAALACDDKSDCQSTQICCFSNGTATCVPSTTACTNTLCANPTQCNGGKCQAFSNTFGLPLQRCQ